jgi:ribose 5-phosphate isomerase RpiB
MNIAIGCDHAGFALKGAVIKHLQKKGYGILDLGTNSAETISGCQSIHISHREIAAAGNI